MQRRTFLLSLATVGISSTGLLSCAAWLSPKLLNPCFAGFPTTAAQAALFKQVWQGIDASQVWDSHVHLIGAGDSSHENEQVPWFNPDMDNYFQHPVLSVQKFFYLNGSCVAENRIDNSYVERLQTLIAGLPAGFKVLLFAFDWQHDAQGRKQMAHSVFHIPNHYAAQLAHSHPAIFEWVASIHPYRADCVDALQQAHAEGARAIKWLPSAMGIDPLSKQCGRFYQAAAALKIPIISHTGEENAVQGGNQALGNPLRLRRALDEGVKVVLAHCASDGEDEDLDQGKSAPRVKSFELFARLMNETTYKSLLYADISAITLRNHAWVIKSLLQQTTWHNRLLNGSDYPLPAILPLFDLDYLVTENLLAADYQPLLLELQKYNPLLFDFTLKRLLRTGENRFPVSVFETRRFFESA